MRFGDIDWGEKLSKKLQIEWKIQGSSDSLVAKCIKIKSYPKGISNLRFKVEGDNKIYDRFGITKKLSNLILRKGEFLILYLVNEENNKEEKCGFDLFKDCSKTHLPEGSSRNNSCFFEITDTLRKLGFKF